MRQPICAMKAKTNFSLGKTFVVAVCINAIAITAFAVGETNRPPLSDRPTKPQYHSPDVARDENLTPQEFVHKAAISGQKEIELSELALEKSNHPEVKQFAHQMILDHAQANRQLQQIAQANAIELPPTNAFSRAIQSQQKLESPRAREAADASERNSDSIRNPSLRSDTKVLIPDSDLMAAQKLKNLSGSEFDQVYATTMQQDHAKAVAKFEKAAASLENDALKRFAADTLPKLRHHKQMADQLVQQVGTSSILGE